jgi:hypothetical protein
MSVMRVGTPCSMVGADSSRNKLRLTSWYSVDGQNTFPVGFHSDEDSYCCLVAQDMVKETSCLQLQSTWNWIVVWSSNHMPN